MAYFEINNLKVTHRSFEGVKTRARHRASGDSQGRDLRPHRRIRPGQDRARARRAAAAALPSGEDRVRRGPARRREPARPQPEGYAPPRPRAQGRDDIPGPHELPQPRLPGGEHHDGRPARAQPRPLEEGDTPPRPSSSSRRSSSPTPRASWRNIPTSSPAASASAS